MLLALGLSQCIIPVPFNITPSNVALSSLLLNQLYLSSLRKIRSILVMNSAQNTSCTAFSKYYLEQLQDGHKPAVHIFSWSRIPNGFLTNVQIQFALYLVTFPWSIYIIYSSRSYYLLFIEWDSESILLAFTGNLFYAIHLPRLLRCSTNPYKIWPPFIHQLILPIIASSLLNLPWALHCKILWC